MNSATILNFPERSLLDSPKETLVHMIVALRSELECLRTESTKTITNLQEKQALRDAELEKLTKANINSTVNQPSSKQPEFNKDTGVDPSKKKKRRKKRKARAGAGHRGKQAPDVVNQNPLTVCPDCQTDLTAQPVIQSQGRIVEDIPPIPEKTIVSEEIQGRKWCSTCAKVVASVSEAALPRSDIGLRLLCFIAYLWVVSAISLPGIAAFLNSFFRLKVSTAGLSRMMIRLGNILTPIHDDILNDVKGGSIIFADETGWRVKGVLWWLWIFANKRSAYYWPDRKRSGADGERLQLARKAIGEEVFMRRLALLKVRLQKLLDWSEPNDILKDIIAKVARQQPYILTFVEHEGVPNHHNYGEYIIKKGILKRKVSGGSMSEEGVTAYAVLQSIAQTCHLRGLSFTGFLTASLLHSIRTGIPLLLSQYELQITNKQALKEAA